MANSPREQVFAALYQLLLSANYPFKIVNTDGMLMRSWEQYPSANQPAMYLQEGSQKWEQNTPNGGMGLNRLTYNAKVWFYFRRDQSAPPATLYNQILDALDILFVPRPGVKQTLAAQNNGVPLVVNIRITESMWDEGVLDPQGGQVVVMVNLEILTSN